MEQAEDYRFRAEETGRQRRQMHDRFVLKRRTYRLVATRKSRVYSGKRRRENSLSSRSLLKNSSTEDWEL